MALASVRGRGFLLLLPFFLFGLFALSSASLFFDDLARPRAVVPHPRGDPADPSGVMLNVPKADKIEYRAGDYIVVLARE